MSDATPIVLYASNGKMLTRYAVDVASVSLTPAESVTLPAKVNYVWQHGSRKYLYVVCSDANPSQGAPGTHSATAFRIDPTSGKLTQHGAAIALPQRPIHMSLDHSSNYMLVAFNAVDGLGVYRINADGTLGDEVAQESPITAGAFPHQILASPDNKTVILVARGNDAAPGVAERPGALNVFDFQDGQLRHEVSVAPNRGFGFGPRHFVFHPALPAVYVGLERQNALCTFGFAGGKVSETPLFTTTILEAPEQVMPRQLGGGIKLHPNGRFVYITNRNDSTVAFDGQQVFAGGENSIAVFALDEKTGEPKRIQVIDSGGYHCRTFSFDPSGQMLVAGHIAGMSVRHGDAVVAHAAKLATFRVGADGGLTQVSEYDVPVSGRDQMFWTGMMAL